MYLQVIGHGLFRVYVPESLGLSFGVPLRPDSIRSNEETVLPGIQLGRGLAGTHQIISYCRIPEKTSENRFNLPSTSGNKNQLACRFRRSLSIIHGLITYRITASGSEMQIPAAAGYYCCIVINLPQEPEIIPISITVSQYKPEFKRSPFKQGFAAGVRQNAVKTTKSG